MDYIELIRYEVHTDFGAFLTTVDPANLVATTPALTATQYTMHPYTESTVVLLGSESRGLSNDVLDKAPSAVRIPMQSKARSLNLAVAAGIVGAHLYMTLSI
jgi:tRNA (cytidine/uridine-2'-O-)-methyltransferase